jgi:hypothetical protein
LKIASLDIALYRGRGAQVVFLGQIGHDYRAARFGDLAQITAKVNEPAWGYLITFTADGRDFRLLQRNQPDAPPEKSAELSGTWRLDDGVGLQAFVLVASRDPLPPYSTWRRQPPKELWWPRNGAGVWSDDNGLCQRLDQTRGPVDEGELPGQATALAQLCRWLKTCSGVHGVRALAFPVEPDPRVTAAGTVGLGCQSAPTPSVSMLAGLLAGQAAPESGSR